MSKLTTKDIVEFLSEKFPNFDKMTRKRKSKFHSWFEWNYTDFSSGISVDTIVQCDSSMAVYFESAANESTLLDEYNVRVFESRLADIHANPFKISKDGIFAGIDYYIHVFSDKEDEKVVCVFVQDRADWYVNLKGHKMVYEKGWHRRKRE